MLQEVADFLVGQSTNRRRCCLPGDTLGLRLRSCLDVRPQLGQLTTNWSSSVVAPLCGLTATTQLNDCVHIVTLVKQSIDNRVTIARAIKTPVGLSILSPIVLSLDGEPVLQIHLNSNASVILLISISSVFVVNRPFGEPTVPRKIKFPSVMKVNFHPWSLSTFAVLFADENRNFFLSLFETADHADPMEVLSVCIPCQKDRQIVDFSFGADGAAAEELGGSGVWVDIGVLVVDNCGTAILLTPFLPAESQLPSRLVSSLVALITKSHKINWLLDCRLVPNGDDLVHVSSERCPNPEIVKLITDGSPSTTFAITVVVSSTITIFTRLVFDQNVPYLETFIISGSLEAVGQSDVFAECSLVGRVPIGSAVCLRQVSPLAVFAPRLVAVDLGQLYASSGSLASSGVAVAVHSLDKENAVSPQLGVICILRDEVHIMLMPWIDTHLGRLSQWPPGLPKFKISQFLPQRGSSVSQGKFLQITNNSVKLLDFDILVDAQNCPLGGQLTIRSPNIDPIAFVNDSNQPQTKIDLADQCRTIARQTRATASQLERHRVELSSVGGIFETLDSRALASRMNVTSLGTSNEAVKFSAGIIEALRQVEQGVVNAITVCIQRLTGPESPFPLVNHSTVERSLAGRILSIEKLGQVTTNRQTNMENRARQQRKRFDNIIACRELLEHRLARIQQDITDLVCTSAVRRFRSSTIQTIKRFSAERLSS